MLNTPGAAADPFVGDMGALLAIPCDDDDDCSAPIFDFSLPIRNILTISSVFQLAVFSWFL